MRTIGRYYEVSLNSAINNTYEFYTEPASINMDCATLQSGIDRLSGMVAEWEYKAGTSTNSTEQNNASSIVQVLQGRLNEYNRIFNSKCLMGSGSGTEQLPATTEPLNLESGSGGGSILIPLLLVAGGIFLITRKKRRGSRRKR